VGHHHYPTVAAILFIVSVPPIVVFVHGLIRQYKRVQAAKIAIQRSGL
jgi:hypothetical protein